MKWYRAAIARKYYATTALIFCEMGRELSFRHLVSFEVKVNFFAIFGRRKSTRTHLPFKRNSKKTLKSLLTYYIFSWPVLMECQHFKVKVMSFKCTPLIQAQKYYIETKHVSEKICSDLLS